MHDLAPILQDWMDGAHRFALAFVVRTSGSAPRPIGSAMAVREDGLIAGSVSGGCVEGAVVQAAHRALKSGHGELLEFGPETDAVLFEVGLSCGGGLAVWVAPTDGGVAWRKLLEAIRSRQPADLFLSLCSERPRAAVQTAAGVWGDEALLSASENVFRRRFEPAYRLLVVGAVHIAIPLVGMAKRMGWETVVVDPRSAFAVPERFPDPPEQLLPEWPDRAFERIGIDARTFVVTLTHDPKIDDPALAIALRSPAAYVGALGGSKTQEKKRATLREMGLSEDSMSRLHGPVGLDLGAESPEEIAVSILAEIVKHIREAKT